MTYDDGARPRSWHDPARPDDTDPADSDPLLVRPWIAGGVSTEIWPATATRPKPVYRGVAAPAPSSVPSAAPAARPPRRFVRRRVMVVAGAGMAAVLGLAAAGLAAFDTGESGSPQALPAGNLPARSGTAPPAGGNPSGATAAPGAGNPNLPPPGPSGRRSTQPGATSPAGNGNPVPTPTAGAPGNGPGDLLPATVEPTLSDPPKAPVAGAIGAEGNLCLDVDGGVPTDNNIVQVFACNQSTAQVWTLETDGTLRVVGLCAQVVADNSVQVIGCDGRAATQWRSGTGGTLVNLATNECLTVPGPAAGGTRVIVAPCGGAGQTWILP